MTIEKLIEKAREFEEKNKSFTWKPNDFREVAGTTSCGITHWKHI